MSPQYTQEIDLISEIEGTESSGIYRFSSFASITFMHGTTTVTRMDYNNTVRIERACIVTSSAARQQSKMCPRSFIV